MILEITHTEIKMKRASILIVSLILFGCATPPKESPSMLTEASITPLPTSWVCSGDAESPFANCEPFIDYLWDDIASTHSFTFTL
jgi:hypothetical protein